MSCHLKCFCLRGQPLKFLVSIRFFYHEIVLLRCVSIAKGKLTVVLFSLTFRFLYKTTTIIANYIKYTDTCKSLVSHCYRCDTSAHLYTTQPTKVLPNAIFRQKTPSSCLLNTPAALCLLYCLGYVPSEVEQQQLALLFSRREEEISAFWNWVGFVMLASPAAGTD